MVSVNLNSFFLDRRNCRWVSSSGVSGRKPKVYGRSDRSKIRGGQDRKFLALLNEAGEKLFRFRKLGKDRRREFWTASPQPGILVDGPGGPPGPRNSDALLERIRVGNLGEGHQQGLQTCRGNLLLRRAKVHNKRMEQTP